MKRWVQNGDELPLEAKEALNQCSPYGQIACWNPAEHEHGGDWKIVFAGAWVR